MESPWVKGPPTADGLYWMVGFRSRNRVNVLLNIYRVDGADAYAMAPRLASFPLAHRIAGEGWRETIEWHRLAGAEDEAPPEGAPGSPVYPGQPLTLTFP